MADTGAETAKRKVNTLKSFESTQNSVLEQAKRDSGIETMRDVGVNPVPRIEIPDREVQFALDRD